MRILFAASHVGFLRNFESIIALLAERGHVVHIVVDRRQVDSVIDGTPIVDRLKARFPGSITDDAAGLDRKGRSGVVAGSLRRSLDYLRYLTPEFAQAQSLRARARRMAPVGLVWLSNAPGLRATWGLRWLRQFLATLEAAVPPRHQVDALFKEQQWDLLLVTPLLYFGSQQVDYVRAARRRGIPSVLGVGSWDHLTTKGVIHEQPDRVVVWNERQRSEAVDLHGVPAERVVVTGAQAYDHWFSIKSAATREEFCARVGLPASRPYLLYLCSSPFITPREVEFVRTWIHAVRASTRPSLAQASILVRPHPQNAKQWATVDFSDCGDATIWPRGGANPIQLSARHEFYDSMYHSHAVVGINTSALIESGIVGRLVYSIRAEEFSGTQEGTLHFQHLKRGGLLRMADSLDEHVDQLERSFDSVDDDREEIRGFIGSFVRPFGLDQPATPRFVEALERTAQLELAPQALTWRVRVIQIFVRTLVAPYDVALLLWKGDRRFWRSTMLHAVRPVRILARRAGRVVRRSRRSGRRIAVAPALRLVVAGRRTARVLRRNVSRVVRRARLLVVGSRPGADSKSDTWR